jgi:Alanine racemase, N-terminal domain
MALTLRVDGVRWREHQDAVAAAVPGLVPVAKGNGYGFGLSLLGGAARRLGADTLAVGVPGEVAAVRAAYDGDVLVLEPYLPEVAQVPEIDDRLVRTVASAAALDGLAGHRVVVELLSSMRRFGLDDAALQDVAPRLAGHRVEGFALHLPLDQPPGGKVAEVVGVAERLARHGLAVGTLWLSHLSDEEVAAVGRALPDVRLRPRVGTRLWLGSGATRTTATVLAVHEVGRGQRFGYRQRRAGRAGHLVVVSGGTSHGIALSAPTGGGLGQRVRVAGAGGLELVGRALSPFRVGGARRWFAEPPHMQVSLVWLPAVEPVPAVGSELDVDVRMTTTTFDEVVVG